MRRWSALVAATIATLVLSGGVAFAGDRLASPGSAPAPQLKSIPSGTVGRLGLTLSPATQPPYCGGFEQAAVARGWLHPGSGGCAISRDVAERAARQGGRVSVVESLLARVSSSHPSVIGTNQLTWLVVLQSVRTNVICLQPAQSASGCARPTFTTNQLVLVDALSSSIVTSMNLNQAGRGVPRPVPVPATSG
jgi:hypothetical protein